MSMLDLLWLFFIVSALSPMLQQRRRDALRLRVLRRLQEERGSQVITLIHRQESVAFLGIPISRFIDIDDSERVLRAIQQTPPDRPIDLILHTPGGLVLATELIAHALIRHRGKVSVFIPHYAMSGGTLIALAADEIYMDANAVLGPVDPQIGQWAAADILKVFEAKPASEISDTTLIRAEMARKALRQVYQLVVEITTANGMPLEKAREIADLLSTGRWTHDYPITAEEARAMGLPVRIGLPDAVYQLMDLYPQPLQRRPSVQYVPAPEEPEPQPRPQRARFRG
ncbi:MAG TPA: ATP-dependent Clp protease proteolytic subunit [Bacillota bacterium]